MVFENSRNNISGEIVKISFFAIIEIIPLFHLIVSRIYSLLTFTYLVIVIIGMIFLAFVIRNQLRAKVVITIDKIYVPFKMYSCQYITYVFVEPQCQEQESILKIYVAPSESINIYIPSKVSARVKEYLRRYYIEYGDNEDTD